MTPLLCTRPLICKHGECVYLLSFIHHQFGKLRRYVLSVRSTAHCRARPTKAHRVTHASGPRQPSPPSTLSGCLRTVGLRGSSKNEWVWRSLNSLSGRQRVDGTETGFRGLAPRSPRRRSCPPPPPAGTLLYLSTYVRPRKYYEVQFLARGASETAECSASEED